jgi:hypothetical protein
MESHKNHGRRFLAAAIAGFLLTATSYGCGEATPQRVAVYPATGSLIVKGQPATGAFVTLHPKSGGAEGVPAPRATVDKEGKFALTTFNGGDGAPEGEYVVTVQWYKLVKNGADVSAGPNVVPPKYSRPESSNIVVRIAAGENTLEPIKL